MTTKCRLEGQNMNISHVLLKQWRSQWKMYVRLLRMVHVSATKKPQPSHKAHSKWVQIWNNIVLAAFLSCLMVCNLFVLLFRVYSCAEARLASHKTCLFVMPKWYPCFKTSRILLFCLALYLWQNFKCLCFVWFQG